MKKVFLGLALIVLCSGCSGIELGGKLGVYRVDEKQESQRTYRKPLPWVCYFKSCEGGEETQGS